MGCCWCDCGGVVSGVTAVYDTVSGYTDSGKNINWANVIAQAAIGTASGTIGGAILPGPKLGDVADTVGSIASAAVGTYLDGGALAEAAQAAAVSFLANVGGGSMGEKIQKRIGKGIDAQAKILHEVASALSAAEKILLGQILAAALNLTIEERQKLLVEALDGCKK